MASEVRIDESVSVWSYGRKVAQGPLDFNLRDFDPQKDILAQQLPEYPDVSVIGLHRGSDEQPFVVIRTRQADTTIEPGRGYRGTRLARGAIIDQYPESFFSDSETIIYHKKPIISVSHTKKSENT